MKGREIERKLHFQGFLRHKNVSLGKAHYESLNYNILMTDSAALRNNYICLTLQEKFVSQLKAIIQNPFTKLYSKCHVLQIANNIIQEQKS